jgi:uracil-DNA glycosylase
MKDPEYAERQRQGVGDPHVAPINRFVDSLRTEKAEKFVPYVAPIYGGVNARLLYVLRDPAKKAQESHLLCWENDDNTAAELCEQFGRVRIDAKDVVPWNAYPWFIDRSPKAAELKEGAEALRRLLDLLPNLRVVMLCGSKAQGAWELLERRYPDLRQDLRLQVISTFHPSPRAFVADRQERKRRFEASFVEAARYLRHS